MTTPIYTSELAEPPTIIFSTSNAFLSRAIKWFTRSRASHALIGIRMHGMPMVLHCTSGGVQITPRAKWAKGNRIIAEFRVKPDVSDGLRHALTHLGDHYDYATIFGWGGAILLWRWLKIKAKNPWQSPTSMVCSEFVCHLDMRSKADGGEEGPGIMIPEWRGLNPDTTHCQILLEHMGESFVKIT